MLIIKYSETEIKPFMAKLIKETDFDIFETRGVEINTFTKIEISGAINKGFYDSDIERDYYSWEIIRPYVFNIIKGTKRPKVIKIVFSYITPTDIHNNAKALFLNISFDNNSIICTTATSQNNFSLDKNLDTAWEEYILQFIKNLKLPFTIE